MGWLGELRPLIAATMFAGAWWRFFEWVEADKPWVIDDPVYRLVKGLIIGGFFVLIYLAFYAEEREEERRGEW